MLHIGYFGDRAFEVPTDLFRGARIFAGREGSASRRIFDRYISRNNLKRQELSYLEDPEQQPDVFVLFAPISPDRLAIYPDIRLLSAGSPDEIGKGSGVDAAARRIRELQNKSFELLVDEELAADESFRIFVSLSNYALREIETRGRRTNPA